jgi:hypothetical protein
MNNLLKTIGGFALVITLVSCEKSNSNQPNNVVVNDTDKISVQTLDGKSTEEVLKIKYNKANLNCNLWVQYGNELNKSIAPNDSFSLDLLKNDINHESSKELSGTAQGQAVEVSIDLKDLKIANETLVNRDTNTTYKMTNTPVIVLDYDYKQTPVRDGGLVISGSGHSERTINEKIKDMSLNISNKSENGLGTYFNYLECSIETDIKAEYQDQFKVEKK